MHSQLVSNLNNCSIDETIVKEEVILPNDLVIVLSRDSNDNQIEKSEKKTEIKVEKNQDKPYLQSILVCCKKCNVMLRKVSVKYTRCKYCEKPFTYECGICARNYKSLYKLVPHVKFDCNKEPAYKCSKCDFKTSRPNYLKWHVARQHTEVQPQDYHECSKCGKRYKRQQIKIDHEKNCGAEAHIKCEYCSYRTHNGRNLRFHMTKKHIEVKTDHECPKCGKKFRWRLHLLRHQEIMHSDERNVRLTCDHCKCYRTHAKSRLINHIFKNHHPDEIFQCMN